MKKQLLFLSVIACLSLTSVSVDASPPVDVGYQHEPTIKLTAAVAPQQMIAITPVEYSFGCSTILTEDIHSPFQKSTKAILRVQLAPILWMCNLLTPQPG